MHDLAMTSCAVTHADLHQTHHQSKQPRNPATSDPNISDLRRPTKPSNMGLERTITHDPLQPYPPLPLTIGHSNKKKKKNIDPAELQPTKKNEPLWCVMLMLGGWWCLDLKRGESRREREKEEREENRNNVREEREISGKVEYFFFFFTILL